MMLDQKSKKLIRKQEWQIKLGLKSVPYLAWGMVPLILSLGFAEMYHFSWQQEAGLFLECAAACVGITLIAQQKGRELEKRLPHLLWIRLRDAGHWYQREPSASYFIDVETREEVTQVFGTTIEQLYDADPAGNILPLPQAVQIMDTFQRQQLRLRGLEKRLAEIPPLRKSLLLKIEQLRTHQESSEIGEQSLRELEDDEKALRELKAQIQSSCNRLEVILLSLKNAVRVRDLHHEVASLAEQATQKSQTLKAHREVESIISVSDIERQITCEVQTYLDLERETNRHMQVVPV